MGSYVYRITAKKVRCTDGEMANIAIFAYKPFDDIFNREANRKMRFKSGCIASETMASKGRITGRFVLGSKDGTYDTNVVFANPDNQGSFYDNYIGTNCYPKIEGVSAI
jgi:hypothetical protein